MNENFSNITNILAFDLDWWNQVKCRTQKEKSNILFKSGEIWWCRVGLNVGEEIYGKGLEFLRPVLIFKKLTGNSFVGLAFTTKVRTGTWYIETNHNQKKRLIMLNQVRTFDKKRLVQRIGTLDDSQFAEIKRKFIEFYSK